MTRVVWIVLAAATVGLSAFIVFLTVTREDVPLRGFAIAAALLAVSVYPLLKARHT